jgi:SAM-dependent methyltransferase
MQKEWWKSFFMSELWLDLQRGFWTEDSTVRAADGVEELLQLTPPAKILDVPCGEGRLSIALASRGYRVTGVDITRPLLEDAKARSRTLGLDIAWEHRDMRDLPWKEEFDAVLCYWGSFGYFDEEGDLEFARAVARVLKPGGRFLVDTHIAETVLPRFQERGWQRVGDILALENRSWDPESGRIDVEWTLIGKGKEETLESSIRIYSYREFCNILRDAGFSECTGHGSWKGGPLQVRSLRALMVATK